ncbi:sensor histidine kinase [Fusibacter sp. 3D3]|uniref:sensor histidine kinase n=1 Tax=Fusibacter sp. 3D3 TaxID=1048380 RepID=UPI000856DF75|nr:ATP-binding protein [Fusibacter sp. 3D3]GAU76931.1 signal transduction histidine kinase [Fusibacter sp. 3D3]
MSLSNWIWTDDQQHFLTENSIVASFFESCAQLKIAFAILTSNGDLLVHNKAFSEIINRDLGWKALLKKEIFLMRSMKKEVALIEHQTKNDEKEQQFEILLKMQLAEEHTLFICQIEEITEAYNCESLILDMNYQLTQKIKEINQAQVKILNQEKLVGIGQLAAGVAHEINNPLGFVKSNFKMLDDYFREITKLLIRLKSEFSDFKKNCEEDDVTPSAKLFFEEIENYIEASDYKYILEDYEGLFQDTSVGLERVEKIVSGLRKFSRVDHMMSFTEFNINEGLEETLMIANNEIKYDAEVIKDMQYVPLTYAIAGEINQVLLNILINAVHAIKEKGKNFKGLIKVTTRSDEKYIYCEIMDNGMGIKTSDQEQIFMPFFTTKEVGLGTGLGMSIAYDIITNKHGGEISFISEYGLGTTFKIKIPIRKVDVDTVDEFMNI